MKIVIDIPKSLYANLPKIVNGSIASKRILDCVKNGTPLPKGHGRLGDLDALEDYIKIDADEWDRYALAYVENAPTIIEADKE